MSRVKTFKNERGMKISLAKTGITTRKGYHLSEEHKRKISRANKGKRYPSFIPEESRERMRQRMLGEKNVAKRPDVRLKIRMNARRGESHPFWRGGVTPIYKVIRKSPEYESWRKSVFERDNYKCIWCGKKSGDGKRVILNADHIKPFAFYPELRFTIENGRTLCLDCHYKTRTFGRPRLNSLIL